MLNIGAYNIVESINTMVFGNNKFRIRRSQSKASYLAYKRERGAPDSEGSYKRTMSPTARLEDWQQQQQQQHQHSANSREHDDPVLLRVTPYHPQQQPQQQQQIPQQQNQQSFHHHNHHHNHNSHSHHSHPQHQPHSNQQLLESPKSHSVDALHQRIEERNSLHSTTVMSKLSHELTKKLQATENRPESNNNSSTTNNNDCHNSRRHSHQESRDSHRERLSPQSALVLHDRNRQLDRERRKLAASCEPLGQSRLLLDAEAASQGIQDFYRERSATIEMTSRNVELLNRRNALAEKNASETLRSSSSSSNSSSSSSSSGNSNISSSSSNSITSSSNSSGRNSAKDENDEVSSVAAGNSSCNSRAKDKTEGRKDCGTGEKSVEKPPSPVTSPPRSPLAFARSEENLQAARGAISRRSASCSSSSSIEAAATTTTVESTRGFREEFEATGGSETGTKFDGTTENSRRKVSSPSQTETNWTTTAGLMSPRTRSSQTEGPNAEIGRISLPRSRSSSMSSGSKISPCVSPQPGIEGLTLVQRSEVVLRVNAATSDAASQTDILDGGAEEQLEAAESGAPVAPEPRRKLREEIECEELSRDLASQLGPNDKLVPILVPAPDHKKPTDYVSDLFRVEATLQPRPRRPPSLESSNSAASVDATSEDDAKNGTMHSTPTTPLLSSDPGNPLSANSAYFTTSEGKARFLTRYSRDVTDKDIMSCSVNSTTLSNQAAPTNDSFHLRQKKEELVLRLDKKVVVLKAEQEAVREEGELNEALGARVASRVSAVARPTEASKYRLHVEEVGKITSLLLGLSGRLARAENALYGMPTNHPERKILESKRDKLMDQLEEAKILKSNIDKRSVNVSAILAKYLNDDEYADYQHFINMKAKLIMDGREIQDKVKLGEEQLAALKEAIN